MHKAAADFACLERRLRDFGRGSVAALAMLVAVAASAVAGGATNWQDTDHTQLRLIAAQNTTGTGPLIRLGLQFRLDAGWKIYWRSPGDAGIPPVFDWSRSQNLAQTTVDWPIPKRFSSYGLESFGYENEVVLPVTVTLARPGAPVRVDLALKYAACANICVPYEASLALDLPAGPAQTTPFAALIARYQAVVPTRAEPGAFAALAAIARGRGRDKTLEITATATTPFGQPDVIVEAPGRLLFGRPRVQISDDRRQATFALPVDTGKKLQPLAGVPLVVTLIDGTRAIERTIVAVPGS